VQVPEIVRFCTNAFLDESTTFTPLTSYAIPETHPEPKHAFTPPTVWNEFAAVLLVIPTPLVDPFIDNVPASAMLPAPFTIKLPVFV
jgi:hypothetical protein